MYMIQPKGSVSSCPVLPFAFDREDLRSSMVQQCLAEVAQSELFLRCTCRRDTLLPLTAVPRDGIYYVARLRGSLDDPGKSHAIHCYHGSDGVPPSLGFKAGVLSRANRQLLLDWDLLLADQEPTTGGGGGGAPGMPADHGPRMRSLLWLLITGAGMNAYHPHLRTRAFFSSLYLEAERIAIGRAGRADGNLADRVLCTDWFDKSHARSNKTKLTVVAPAKRKWVTALCLLPGCQETAASESAGKAVNLFKQLGASVHLPINVLKAGLAACPEAHSWHQAGKKVLMLGLVRAQPVKGSKGAFVGFVRHFALIPLHERYVPVPSVKHVRQLEEAIGRRDLFVVEAEEDLHLARSQ